MEFTRLRGQRVANVGGSETDKRAARCVDDRPFRFRFATPYSVTTKMRLRARPGHQPGETGNDL